MKKVQTLSCIIAIALGTAFGSRIAAQEKPTTEKATTVRYAQGKVEMNGDKVTFVTSGGQKKWDVINPSSLKGQAGHYAHIKGRFYFDKSEIRVIDVMKTYDKDPCGEGGSEGIDCPPPK